MKAFEFELGERIAWSGVFRLPQTSVDDICLSYDNFQRHARLQ